MSDLISRSELTKAIKRQYCTGCDNYNGSRCRACHADDDAEQWVGQYSVNAKHYVTHWMPLPEPPKEE